MGDPVVMDYEGREIRFCCEGCKPKFEKDPETYLKKIDAEIVKAQKSYYPLDTCVVSGEKLGEGAVDHVYKNRLVRFCCPNCAKAFAEAPDKYLSKIDAAVIEKQKTDYPLDTCVVLGDKLGNAAVDHVFGNRLIRFCCPACIKEFEKDPAKYLSKVDDAMKGKDAKM
jgi:YHS domain-containing protein